MNLRAHTRAARLATISILTLLAAIAAVWTAPRVSGAVEAWMSAPPVDLSSATLAAPLPVAETAPAQTGARASSLRATEHVAAAVTLDAGMRFTMAGVTCTPPARTGDVEVLLRTSEDGATWSRWYSVPLERAAENGGAPEAFTEAVWTGAGRYVQVAAQSGAASAPTRLRHVKVVAINSTENADTASALVGVVRRTAATIAGLHLTSSAAAMTTKPEIVTRAEWGANESWRGDPPSYAPVHMAFVHHTASGNGYSAAQAPAVVRGTYAYHTKALHWNDIGYNFLIDRYGVVYEGRYGGMTSGVSGAQVLGFNTGSTGISVIGTFSKAAVPSAVVTSLERLLAWKLDVHHVDPLGKGTLICGYGQKYATGQAVTFNAIAGHRDANFTDCPGARLYGLLPTIRQVVARTGQPKIYGSVTETTAFSPNGDGVQDKVGLSFGLSGQVPWTLEARDEDGTVVRHWTGTGDTAVTATWTGKDDAGNQVPDGVYTLVANASSPEGAKARPASATVRLDTTPPDVVSTAVAPDPFSPNGDGQADSARLRYTPSEPVTARVSVLGSGGAVLRRLTAWKAVTAAQHTLIWDGRVTSGAGLAPAPEGTLSLLIEERDDAGNIAAITRKVTVDRTLALTGVSAKALSPNGDGVRDDISMTFKLAHAADVVVTVGRGGVAVRTWRPGRLGEGTRSVAWDGKLDDTTTATAGSYVLKVTADGPYGVTAVARTVAVDLARPRLTAPLTARAAVRKTARLAYTVKDADSALVSVSAVVTNSKGVTVATVACGSVKQGVAHVCPWKPKARGVYTVTFSAVDRGGNRQVTPAATSVRVR